VGKDFIEVRHDMRPLIGVTCSRRGGWRNFLLHRLALRRTGGKAVHLAPRSSVELEELSGLIVGGGDDISAELYGGELTPDIRIDPERDAFEIDLLGSTLPTKLPVLGICRGAQMVNVALGGSLHGDIYSVYAKAERIYSVLPRKKIWIEDGSRLSQILSCNPCRVNARCITSPSTSLAADFAWSEETAQEWYRRSKVPTTAS
jgi:putative glutamine amidotransferase